MWSPRRHTISYGLRDYGTALWDGGDAACDHKSARTGGAAREAADAQRAAERGYVPSSNFANYGAGWTDSSVYRDTCGKCGAVRVDRQIGLEATPDAYLATMVGVFREVRRVLRRDGTCWVNMGDSYCSSASTRPTSEQPQDGQTRFLASKSSERRPGADIAGWSNRAVGNRLVVGVGHGIKPKDLLLMPARLALALQADGWFIRSDIIWHKPNPMPESCRDRPTSAHEHVFLLTRSARYYYDADAVREEALQTGGGQWGGRGDGRRDPSARTDLPVSRQDNGSRSLRNVWTIATSPYPNAHFATYPAELAERCIKAGTSERGCCAVCGKPWVRVTERNLDNVPTRMATKRAPIDNVALGAYLRERREARGLLQKGVAAHFPSATGGLTGCVANWELGLNTPMPEQWTKLKDVLGLDDRFDEQIYGTVEVQTFVGDWRTSDRSADLRDGNKSNVNVPGWEPARTTGWSPGCQCGTTETRPCVVLDPFAGAGTTLLVADRLQRDAIGIELNTAYTEMAMERCRADAPLFTSFPPAEDPEETRMADLFTDMAAD